MHRPTPPSHPAVLLASCVAVTLALAGGQARADHHFDEASLDGEHAFRMSGAVPGNAAGGFEAASWELHATGILSFDGAGGVTGRRILHRPVPSGRNPGVQSLIQNLEGDYFVEPDGTGFLTLTPSANPSWPLGTSVGLVPDETERIDFVVSAGGGLELLGTIGASYSLGSPPVPVRWSMSYAGRSTPRETASDDADELRRVQGQLCEVLRLLTTPSGLRETEHEDVLEACGRGYDWNAGSRLAPAAHAPPAGLERRSD